MTNATCKECSGTLTERPQKSKRPGEILLICPKGHKWQARIKDGFLHLYRSNWKGCRGEGRKIATITISPFENSVMQKHNLMQQDVFRIGIDTLINKQ